MCRSFMWREYMVGCHVPAKVLALLPADAQDIKLFDGRVLEARR